MGEIFSLAAIWDTIPKLLQYLPVTLEITVLSLFFGLILGFLFALIKINKTPVIRQMVAVLVSFVRGTPLIVQLYLTYTGIPLLLKYYNYSYGTDYNINSVPAMLFVLVTFSINQAAYNSENIRAALQSVGKGEIEAGHSIGMSYFQIMRRIILPKAFIYALPILGNTLIGLLKGTSLAFVCAVVEMTAQSKIIAGVSYRYFEAYLALALIYWVVTIIIEQIVNFIERKMMIPDNILK
ncbi:amino acid ABC transporter permease [Lonepinella koalarum]|uniref:amino acid ABC transporter permease n=1 Tax=Lonepinella koalarum TaxID=53417 RepID=UPI003F6E2229